MNKQDPDAMSTTATSLKSEKSIDVPPGLSPEQFELGKAEAVGALCRIFCNKKTSEEISPLYLARFYLALQKGLQLKAGKPGVAGVTDTLGSIVVNAAELFRVNLEGVNIVLPQFVTALEAILPERESGRAQFTSVPSAEVRRSAIQILLSILPLPLHFKVINFYVKLTRTLNIKYEYFFTVQFHDFFSELACEKDGWKCD